MGGKKDPSLHPIQPLQLFIAPRLSFSPTVPAPVPVVSPERAAGIRADGVPAAHEDGDLTGQARDQLLPGQRREEPDPGQAEEEESEEG